MNTTRMAALAASAITIGAGVVATAPPASAGDADVVRASGACATGTWKLKAKHDDGGIEWEFEVDTNRNGQRWQVRVRDNGDLIMSGVGVTSAPSGSFEIGRTTADKAGSDRIVARATRGDVVCVGRVTV
ncbi:hypothetical protein [Nocardioides pelophilus]|uniref:hypothetical protein n=1 Tax=Nocardioides pelophilus TaxID=2172019 RepID=UPI0016004766|nr:hypothetical protein [Nocardioides pelophilus]